MVVKSHTRLDCNSTNGRDDSILLYSPTERCGDPPNDIILTWSVTQYPIPAITVPGRMRYSRHKRSGISYGCHNESPRTTFSCHKRSCFAISYPLSRMYCRCRMYRRFGVGVSADVCSLLPPPNGSSMAMQINARTHSVSEPFMATKSFHILLPQTFYANAIFPHTPWTFYGNEVMYTLKLY